MLSEFDVTNIHSIMAGHGDWFSAQLMRLIHKASGDARRGLELGFPNHVELVDWWYEHRADDPPPMHLVGSS